MTSKFLNVVIVGVVVLIVVFANLIIFVEKHKCEELAAGLQLEAQWSMLQGCRVEINDRLVPVEWIRITQDGEIFVDTTE